MVSNKIAVSQSGANYLQLRTLYRSKSIKTIDHDMALRVREKETVDLKPHNG